MLVEQRGKDRTVADYRWEFIGGVTHLERVPEAVLIGAFLRGLIENVEMEVRILTIKDRNKP